MIQQIDAIYENGLLRPSQPLRLAEHERVQVLIVPQGEDDLIDRDFTIDTSEAPPEFKLNRQRVAQEIAEFAAAHGGSELDLDRDLETASLEVLGEADA